MMTGRTDDIAGNMYGFYRRVGELCGYDQGTIAGCPFVWNRKGSWPSFILGNPSAASVPEADSAISAKLAPAFWIMEKAGDRLSKELDKAGIRAIREWKGMELYPDEYRSAYDSGIRILTNEPSCRSQWLEIVNKELLSGSQLGPEFLDSISSSDQFSWMLAFLDGRPVGTGLSYSENGVCGLYMIATETSSRGKGVATRLSSEMVSQALDAGDTYFVLHATPLGVPVYEKLGFREVNTFSVLWKLGC